MTDEKLEAERVVRRKLQQCRHEAKMCELGWQQSGWKRNDGFRIFRAEFTVTWYWFRSTRQEGK